MKELKNTVSTFCVIMTGLIYKTVLYSIFICRIPFLFPAAIILPKPISTKLRYSETWKWQIFKNSSADAFGDEISQAHISQANITFLGQKFIVTYFAVALVSRKMLLASKRKHTMQ